MRVLIHACPQRMWYVEEFMVPALLGQGLDPEDLEIWNDSMGYGCLRSCMVAFASRYGNGGTWHLQDDVLIASDFVRRCREHDQGVVYGFCCEYFTDDPGQTGHVYPPDAWHSFQCVRIPDEYARACAEWYLSGAWRMLGDAQLEALAEDNRGDDTFFREWMQELHPAETVENLRPNLVEHVDRWIGGSVLHQWRDYPATAYYWQEPELTEQLRARLRLRAANH